ncbi:MAG: CDP-alcohol phosphatidyltransferase family protein [Pseudomonadota bacterium]
MSDPVNAETAPATAPGGAQKPRNDWALIPNWLSAGRILAAAALPFAFILFERQAAEIVALGLFIAASITDFFDGWLARRLNQTSALGAKLDSLADKALLFTALGALGVAVFPGALWFWALALIIVAREVGVTLLRMRFGRAGALSVTLGAKWKTVFQMTSAALLLAAGPAERALGSEIGAVVFWSGAVLLALAAWLSVTTGLDYLKRALQG